jgi:hypothetical protein
MQPPYIKIKANLFINGKSVHSYATHVADIVQNEIVEVGKFSRTTTRHIGDVARATGFRVKNQGKLQKTDFYKFEMGVKCEPNNTLSNKASGWVLDYLKAGKTYFQALCRLMDEKIHDRDRDIIQRYLAEVGEAEDIQLVRDLEKIS